MNGVKEGVLRIFVYSRPRVSLLARHRTQVYCTKDNRRTARLELPYRDTPRRRKTPLQLGRSDPKRSWPPEKTIRGRGPKGLRKGVEEKGRMVDKCTVLRNEQRSRRPRRGTSTLTQKRRKGPRLGFQYPPHFTSTFVWRPRRSCGSFSDSK